MNNTIRPVFLWGMMGAGKTTAGNYLRKNFGLNVIDLDAFVEGKEGKSIGDLFNTYGETRFREMESIVLHDLLYSLSPDVIVTGGGTPCYHQNDEWMLKNGLTIFIDCPIPVLTQRILNDQKHRPLLDFRNDIHLEDQLRFLLTSRFSYYRKAEITLRVNDSMPWMPTLAGLIYSQPMVKM